MTTTEATFEVYPYDRRQPALTFRARGAINLNSSAYKLLERPEAVLLMFDRENRRVAVKKTDKEDLRAYPVNKHRKNNASIPAKRFLDHYDIRLNGTTRFSASLEGRILVANL